MTDDLNTSGGRNLTAMTLWSWAKVYGAPSRNGVAPAAMQTVNLLAQQCIEGAFDILIREKISGPLERSFLTVKDPATVEPWRSLLQRNTPGELPAELPVFLAPGTSDRLVRPEVTEKYMRRLCRAGSSVRMLLMPNVSHGFAGYDSAVAAISSIGDRFAGASADNNC